MARGTTALCVASAGFGFYYGTYASSFPVVMGDFFGRGSAGALVGLSFTMGSITSAIGPFAMGWVADRTGHSVLAFLCCTVVNGGVAVLLALAHPPTRRPQATVA